MRHGGELGRLLAEKFDPDQPRDEQGRWTSGGGGGGGAEKPLMPVPPGGGAQIADKPSAPPASPKAKLRYTTDELEKLQERAAANEERIDEKYGSNSKIAAGAAYIRAAIDNGIIWSRDNKSITAVSVGEDGDPLAAASASIFGGKGGNTGWIPYVGSIAAGQGRLVMEDLIAQAQERDLKSLGGSAQIESLGFFEKLGFVAQPKREGTISAPGMPEISDVVDIKLDLTKSGTRPKWLVEMLEKYDPDQPRDEQGRWTSGGGGGGTAADKPSAPPPAMVSRPTGRNAAGADQRVSTSIPSKAAQAKQGSNAHQRQDLQPSLETFNQAMKNPKMRAGVANIMQRYSERGARDKNGNELYPPFLRVTDEAGRVIENPTPEQMTEAFIEHAKKNIKALYNKQDPKIREQSKLWYEGANKIAHDLAAQYSTDEHTVEPKAVAAVIASLSPQRDWDQNVELAKRVLNVAVKNRDVPFGGETAANAKVAMGQYRDRQLEDKAKAQEKLAALKANPEATRAQIQAEEKKIKNRDRMVKRINELERSFEGKTLSQLPENLQPIMLRMYDTGNAPVARSYTIWNPDGTDSGQIGRNNPTKAQRERGEEGSPKQSGWGGFASIGNALSVLRDDSNANISQSLGDNHKVRNFYANIVSPNYGQDTTIDTHAVAASMLMPLGQSSPLVKEGLGMSGPKNAETGLKGLYALHYEAYNRAAAEISEQEGRMVLPREMQSASWEALRGLYTDKDKRNPKIRAEANAVWERYGKGEISLAAAQREILSRPIQPPRWYKKN